MQVNKITITITLEPAKLSSIVEEMKQWLTSKKAQNDILYAKGTIQTVEEPLSWDI